MITNPTIVLTAGSTTYTFAGADVIAASLIEEVDPISIELPYNVLEISVYNTDPTLSVFSEDCVLSERLPVDCYESVNGISQYLGRFYLDTFKNTNDYTLYFRAFDAIGTMAKTDYDGGFWAEPTSLLTVLNQILLPKSYLFEVDASIQSTTIQGWNPPADFRAALQQICFAAGAMASCSRRDRVVFSPVELPYQLYDKKVTNTKKLMDQPIELLNVVTSIELVSHNYTAGTDPEIIFDKDLTEGQHKIVFNQPYYNIVVDGPGFIPITLGLENDDDFAFEDGDLLEISGEYIFDSPNSIVLVLQEAGHVTITGYPWIDSKRSYIFQETGLAEYANKNSLLISDATMINSDNAQTVLDRVRDYYRQRYKQTFSLLPSTIIKPMDIVASTTVYDKLLLGFVQKMEINLVGGFIQVTDIRGIEAVYIPPVEHPVRRARTGIAICGAGLTRNNGFRNY
jgi:hypothetical protein